MFKIIILGGMKITTSSCITIFRVVNALNYLITILISKIYSIWLKKKLVSICLIDHRVKCRKGKFPTYHKLARHTTKSIKYSQLQSTTYCCQVLQSLLRNQQKFAKCHTRTNHTSTRVSDDISILARVSDDTGGLAHVSDDIGGPIKLWHVSPIRLRHVSLTHP